MFTSKNIILVVLVALLSISCGTDGLDVDDQESLSFTNTGDFYGALDPDPDGEDGIPAGQSFSFTLDIENGSATGSNLSAFSSEGDWLSAESVNGGSQMELSGTPPYPPEGDSTHTFGYSLTAIDSNENNAYLTFEIEVYDPDYEE